MNSFEKKYLKMYVARFMLALIGLFTFTNNFAAEASAVRLQKEQVEQARQDAVDTRTLNEVVESKESDLFTQTEAHLSLPEMRKLIHKWYKVEPDLNIISTIIANESKYKNTHYAFYHTTPNPWRLAQDLYTLLYARFKDVEVSREFKFLRYSDEHAVSSTPQGFLIKELRSKGLVDDSTDTKFLMLSANLSLFGNVGFPGECSWEYFKKPQEHATPVRAVYEQMMKDFELTDKYIDEIMSLVDIYDTQEDTLIQILVPKDKIDDIGYLAWVHGIPAHQETIDWILKTAKGTSYTKDLKPTLEQLVEMFAKAKARNPLYKDMIESIKEGDFSIDAFLKIYRNKPWEIENINDVSARLLFTPDVLLNPASGVKFYRFSTARQEQLKEFRTRLDSVVDKLVAEKEAREDLAAAAA